ncbi:MAG: low molecular weight protein-tyrosine-phosphatase [Flavobacterium sp.]|jgi:protein-tyrosine phosphatase
MTKILMVCLGNICRSPLAEGILRSKLPNTFLIDSAGTGGWHAGELPDKRSIEIAKKKGIDITNQRARKFTKNDFTEFDLIFAMDNSNFEDILKLAPDEISKKKVHLILNEIYPNENRDVPDPYFGLNDGFEKVYQMLDEACDSIAKKIIKEK